MRLKDGKIVCDFCLVHEDSDEVIVAGDAPRWAAICAECVSYCVKAIAGPAAKQRRKGDKLTPTPTPVEA